MAPDHTAATAVAMSSPPIRRSGLEPGPTESFRDGAVSYASRGRTGYRLNKYCALVKIARLVRRNGSPGKASALIAMP